LHLIQDDEEPYQLVRQLVGALAPGSYVVISHALPEAKHATAMSQPGRRSARACLSLRDTAEPGPHHALVVTLRLFMIPKDL
jgi:hypothetical protein